MSVGIDDWLGGERRIGEWWKAKVDLGRDDVLGFFCRSCPWCDRQMECGERGVVVLPAMLSRIDSCE